MNGQANAGSTVVEKSWPSSISATKKTSLIGILLFGLVLMVFLPATRNEFVTYDDPAYVTENPHVHDGLAWANLKWALTTSHAANWHPLTWLSHMADCQFYGPKPSGHHLTSVLLHALNTLLLFLALRKMTGAMGRSLVVALLFGLHPLRVESVAWVAERKDVLSGLFFMLILLAYAQYVQLSKANNPKSRLFYALALAAFAFGLMSKPMLVTVPFVLLLLDWWPLNRIPASDARVTKKSPVTTQLLIEKAPFFLLAAASSVVTFQIQQSDEAVVKTLPFVARVESALVSYCLYVGKLFWPVDLAVYYPHKTGWPLAIILTCAVMLAVVSFFSFSLSHSRPYFFVGWFWYLGMLMPVIGLVQVGTQSMADRYAYLPTIGFLVMMVWALHDLSIGRRSLKIILSLLGVATVLACIGLTCRQIGYWHDSETLFRHALAVTKENGVALDNLGRALGEKGKLDEAMEQFQEAIELNANDPYAENGLGALLMKKHDYDGAADYLRKALELDPKNAQAHYNLGIAQANRGFLDDAINHFEESIQLLPDYADAHNNLGSVLVMRKRFNDAIPHYRKSIRLKPGIALTHKNLGAALFETGQLDEAINEFQEAIRLQPHFLEAQEKLRIALESKSKTPSQINPP